MPQLDLFGFGQEPGAASKKKEKERVPKERGAEETSTETADTSLFADDKSVRATDFFLMPETSNADSSNEGEGNQQAFLNGQEASFVDVELSDDVRDLSVVEEDDDEVIDSIDLVSVEAAFETFGEESATAINEQSDEEISEAENGLGRINEPIVEAADNNAIAAITEQEETPTINKEEDDPFVFSDGKIRVRFKSKEPKEVEPKAEVKAIEEKPLIVKKLPQKRGRKSFKEIDAEVDLIEIPEDEVLFQRQYYPISTVAGWFRVNTSLLRYWENEFDILKPRKNRKGDRLFRPEDVKNLVLIHHLLRQKKYTIDGAKDFLKTNKKKADIELQLTQTLQKFKSFLLELKANLQP